MPGTSDGIFLDCGCIYSLRRLVHENIPVSKALDGQGVICGACRPHLESKHLKDIREVTEALAGTTESTANGLPCWCEGIMASIREPADDEHDGECQARRTLIAKWRA